MRSPFSSGMSSSRSLAEIGSACFRRASSSCSRSSCTCIYIRVDRYVYMYVYTGISCKGYTQYYYIIIFTQIIYVTCTMKCQLNTYSRIYTYYTLTLTCVSSNAVSTRPRFLTTSARSSCTCPLVRSRPVRSSSILQRHRIR